MRVLREQVRFDQYELTEAAKSMVFEWLKNMAAAPGKHSLRLEPMVDDAGWQLSVPTYQITPEGAAIELLIQKGLLAKDTKGMGLFMDDVTLTFAVEGHFTQRDHVSDTVTVSIWEVAPAKEAGA